MTDHETEKRKRVRKYVDAHTVRLSVREILQINRKKVIKSINYLIKQQRIAKELDYENK